MNIKNIANFLRKIGLLHVSSGDYITGEYDDRKDIKKEKKAQIISNKNTTNKIFIIAVILILILLLFSYLMLNLSFWFILLVLLLGSYILYIKNKASKGLLTLRNFSLTFILILIAVFFIIIIGIPANTNTDSSTNTKQTTTSNVRECKANNLPKKINDRITAEIVRKDNISKLMNSSSYSLEDLHDLMYGFSIKKTPKGDYVLAEICRGSKHIDGGDFDTDVLFYENPEGINSSGGNYTQFSNEQSDGSINNIITEPGQYTLYIYVSNDKNSWSIAKEIKFEVK